MKAISLVSAFLIGTTVALAQVDEARQAIQREDYVRAVNILSEELAVRPSPDAYLYLGIAYRRMKEYAKAEDLFKEGSKRYENDARFHTELANMFLENNDFDAAKNAFRMALAVDPGNYYASDQLAVMDMSQGDVQAALEAWNKSDRPHINDILHNYYLGFGSWVVRDAIAFQPSGTLKYSEWKTTEWRLLQTENFSNVGIEIEPTRVPDQYNAVVRTSRKTNSLSGFAFNLIRGAPFETTYVNLWNMRNSGVNFNGLYRWDANRRRAEGLLKIPLPIGGLVQLELGDIWRKERWDVSKIIEPDLLPDARFDYDDNGIFIYAKHIPHYRVELGGGFNYRNRAASGNLPQIYTDSLNTGKFGADVTLRLFGGKYQNQLRLEAFTAQPSIVGNLRFTGGTSTLDNRLTLSKDSRTYFDWSLKGGSARGQLPVDDYFVLGLERQPKNLLRGHTVADHGKYGNGPMGTDFVLLNTDVERRLATIPFFNILNIPYITMKWELFFDAAKTWDRADVFQPSKLLLDTGAGLKFETPTNSFTFVYGRSLRDGQQVFYGYYERRLW